MRDYGHIETDKQLAALERRITELYRDARDDLQEKIREYFENFAERDKKQRALVEAGKVTEDHYKQWRLNQIGRGTRFEALRDAMAERYTKANEVATAYINDTTPGVYSLNRNYAAYTIEQQTGGSVAYTLWDEQSVKRLIADEPGLMPYYPPKRALKRGIDLAWGKTQITKQVTSGILQGESIGKIADRLQKNIPGMERASAVRAARTATTGAQNAGRMDSYAAAEKMGIELEREWIATLDGRTRHEHRLLDGQRAEQGKPFSVDGYEIMYPGDPTAKAHLVYNCRCTLAAVIKGVEASGVKRRARTDGGKNEVIENISYQEWEKSKKALMARREDSNIISGAISGALNPESKRAKAHADKYYEAVRSMTTDVSSIAKNTGYSEADIQRIKSFVFFEEHELEPGVVRRFHTSYEMANSWQRLIEGKHIERHDLTLLAHEKMEIELMDKGHTQDEAHIAATEKYNYAKEAYEYYGRIKEHKGK